MIKYLIKHLFGKTVTCRDVSAFLSDYLAGDLDAETTNRFEEHMRYCRSCEAYLAQFRTTIELIHGDKAPEPPPELAEHTLAFLKSQFESE